MTTIKVHRKTAIVSFKRETLFWTALIYSSALTVSWYSGFLETISHCVSLWFFFLYRLYQTSKIAENYKKKIVKNY